MTFAQPTVTVTGFGAVTVPRTSALVRVAAVHRAPSLAEALSGGESAREVLVGVARQHAEADDVATQSLDVWPVSDDEGRPTGFEARHALSIRCADAVTAGALVTALAEEVGDRLRIEGVSLDARPTAEATRIARERAFDDARQRAEHLAGLAGLSLGTPVSVEEGSARGGGFPVHAEAARLAVGIEPGTTSVETAVTVTFACS